jgi:uncharacterized protein involved in exopolysaccharide biosynthesis
MSATNRPDHALLPLIWASIFARKWLVAGIVATFTIALTALAFVLPPVYRMTAVLIPAEPMEGSRDLSSMFDNIGGLAALAGLNFSRNTETTEAVAILHSRQFTEAFIRDQNLLPRLFPRSWDDASGKWKVAPEKVPSLFEGYRKFDRKIRRVTEDKKNGLVILDIEWTDPKEGARWANELVDRVNAIMRQNALAESDASVKFLDREMTQTNVVSVQQAISRAIEFNVKRRALAATKPEYAFRIVDPAAPPDRDAFVRPQKALFLVAGLVIGSLFAVAVVVFLEYVSPNGVLRARRSS